MNKSFQINVINHLCSLEKFIIDEDKKNSNAITFYGKDLNYEKLKRHRDMICLLIKKAKQIEISITQDAIDFL